MAPHKSLRAFLATARAALTAPPSKRTASSPPPLHFVVGNESADLDSLCSALFLAYFRTYSPLLRGKDHSRNILHIPVCNLPRDDLALRPEFAAVMRWAGVQSLDEVVTLSELLLPLSGSGGEGKKEGGGGEELWILEHEETRWVLVDHNVLTGALAKAFGNGDGEGRGVVDGCIDHHDDEGVVPPDARLRVIEKCGSCMSLVVEECAKAWEALGEEEKGGKSEDGDMKKINAQLAKLALAPILIDTTNLGDANKTTPRDERAVAVAEAWIADAADSYDRAKFFAELSALKADLSPLSIYDILRKDYKEWVEEGNGSSLKLGTSSIAQPIAFLVDKAGGEEELVKELEAWATRKELDVVALLTACEKDGVFMRDLLVWARNGPEVVEAVKGLFEGNGKETLGLSTWGEGRLDAEDGEGSWRRCWRQAGLRYSRKQIAPMLREALKGVGKT